jgi:hypothetical protein
MRARRAVVAVGVGATAFLVAFVAGIELVGRDSPSLLTILPGALVTAVVATIGVAVFTGRELDGSVLGLLTGIATFGYAVFAQFGVRFAVPATRRALQLDVIGILAGLLSGLVAAGIRSREAD